MGHDILQEAATEPLWRRDLESQLEMEASRAGV
jgi:hypothetical protein